MKRLRQAWERLDLCASLNASDDRRWGHISVYYDNEIWHGLHLWYFTIGWRTAPTD